MTIKCIYYDCVGPLLVKDPNIKVNTQVSEIDNLCGSAINDQEFWQEIRTKYKLSTMEVNNVIDEIASSYMKNDPMWQFHKKIRKKYKTAVINNGTFSIFKRWIEKYNMTDHFDSLFNSAELGVRKPDKKIFEICAKEMGVELPESILIDDCQYNVDGAMASGMSGIYYQPGHHSKFIVIIERLIKVE